MSILFSQVSMAIKNTLSQISKSSVWALIIFVSIAFAFMNLMMPIASDDLMYSYPIRDFLSGISDKFPWAELKEHWIYRYNYDNSRFGNVIFPFILMGPKWIPAFISGCAVAITLILCNKLISVYRNSSGMFITLIAMFVIVMPWYDEMFFTCFVINYIWATCLSVAVLYIFFKHANPPKQKYKQVLLLIVSFLAGGFHEGMSLPIFLALSVYIALNHHTTTKWQIAITATLLPGLIFLLTSGGFSERISINTTLEYLSKFYLVLKYNYCILLFIGTIIVCLTFKRGRNIIKQIPSSILLVFLIIAFISYGIHVLNQFAARVGWMCQLSSFLGCIYIWRQVLPNKATLLSTLYSTILTIIIALHLSLSCYYGYNISKEFDIVLERYQQSTDGTVFADITTEHDVSPFVLKKPYYELFTYTWNIGWFDIYHSGKKKFLAVVPESLRDTDISNATKIPGNAPFYQYDGHFIIPAEAIGMTEPIEHHEIEFLTTFEGYSKPVRYLMAFYTSAYDGRNYVYAYPTRIATDLWRSKIVSIDSL